MKKSIIFRFFGMVLLIAFFGLNITQAQSKELLIWHYERDNAMDAAWQVAMDDFAKTHPGVSVKFERKVFEQIQETARMILNSRACPDVMYINKGNSTCGIYAKDGLITPLDEVAVKYGWDKILKPSIQTTCRYDQNGIMGSGKLYGVTNYGEFVLVYYNKGWFNKYNLEVPTSLEEFEKVFYKMANDDPDGNNIKDFKLKSLRNNIGVVQQDVYIFNGTIKDNISYGNPNADDAEIIEAAKKANIHDFITSLPDGYDTKVGERGARLSGGQKQRISIARVFLKNPRILILDEATSALDNESEKHIQEALDQLAKNRTTIVIAHRLSTIRNADIIYVIAEGKIKEKGNHKELMAQNGLYSRYYNMQFEGIDEL